MSMFDPQILNLLENDQDIKDALKTLALESIARAQELLDNAIPSIQMQVIRSILPAMTKALNAQDNREITELREQVAGMYAMIQAQITPDAPDASPTTSTT